MAKSDTVWGIDIGQCALKAIRCRVGDETGQLVAEAFDYVEYPKILSQPEAEPAELIREALQTFLSRNNVKGDRVAISVAGQSGLARFIKLPPVEASKVPDIVKYEARQQIPFPLEDVVWDYQQLAGGVEEGYALETEVGLFAMKRDQVHRALQPFDEAGIEVDIVQLAPLALYNYVLFDQFPTMKGVDSRSDSSSWVVVLSLGTDTSDLVLTNGHRVWQRNIPLGGNHFTKALTKSMKLTFAKAEHVKRNPTKAEDPKAVYQTMRSVCNDLVTEIHRSLSYFASIEKDSKIVRVLAMGNTMKLQGLPQFLSKHLEMNVVAADSFKTLSGPDVVNAPAFKDNVLSFTACYGLVVQGLDEARLKTNLLPREIIVDRLVREKKPWIVAAVAATLLAMVISFLGHWRAWSSANVSDPQFTSAMNAAKTEEANATRLTQEYDGLKKKHEEIEQVGKNLVANVDNRVTWLEMLKALNAALPYKEKYREKPPWKRPEIKIESMDCERFERLEDWFTGWKADWEKGRQQAAAAQAAGAAASSATDGAAPADAAAKPAPAATGPSGPGWVIEIKGRHYFNEKNEGAQFVRDTLIKNLEEGSVELPVTENGQVVMKTVTMQELGIGYPVLTYAPIIADEPITASAEEMRESGETNIPASGTGTLRVRMQVFRLQFCWQETPPSKRRDKAQKSPTGRSDVALGERGPQGGGE